MKEWLFLRQWKREKGFFLPVIFIELNIWCAWLLAVHMWFIRNFVSWPGRGPSFWEWCLPFQMEGFFICSFLVETVSLECYKFWYGKTLTFYFCDGAGISRWLERRWKIKSNAIALNVLCSNIGKNWSWMRFPLNTCTGMVICWRYYSFLGDIQIDECWSLHLLFIFSNILDRKLQQVEENLGNSEKSIAECESSAIIIVMN